MKCIPFVPLSIAGVAFAASVSRQTFPPSNTKTIDATSYKAIANGTLSLAELYGQPHGALRKRDAGNVFLCVAANWQSYCVYITDAGPNECVNLASDLNDQVSSFGPDPNQSCTMFAAADCNPSFGTAVGPIVAPGIADLSRPFNIGQGQIVNGFNDVLSSYSCSY
ncbi:hypothetical protein MVEN_02243500 [Mycena venus]|uniref:Uncharacterized protein n=1 Tax=Mycena venus TaxID=2733690 RepID=A0A8H6X5M2_9AGAR|nr:hypothetical protein MVEN_02243500 [Mycena venus]